MSPPPQSQALAGQAQAVEDYLAAGGDEGLEERPLDAPIDPFADIDPDLIGGEGGCMTWV
jgi:hypothetical protein